jgi:hypothetical protein
MFIHHCIATMATDPAIRGDVTGEQKEDADQGPNGKPEQQYYSESLHHAAHAHEFGFTFHFGRGLFFDGNCSCSRGFDGWGRRGLVARYAQRHGATATGTVSDGAMQLFREFHMHGAVGAADFEMT